MRPVRSGFIMTPSRITSEPGVISAATSGNAAEDGSAGTTIGCGVSSGWPVSVMRRPWPRRLDPHLAPKCASIFSVWSRVASASMTTVSPGAESPASSVADFNCADGTGGSNTIGIGSRAPASVSGRRPSSRQRARADALQRIEHAPHRPAAQRGVAVERRRDRAAGDRAEHEPAAGSRIAEIERAAGSAKPPTPTPWTRHSPAPCARRGRRAPAPPSAVLRTSSPSSRPLIRVSPTASAPRISARMRDRLVAGHAHAAGQRAVAAGGERRGSLRSTWYHGVRSGGCPLAWAAAARHSAVFCGKRRRSSADPLLTGAPRLAK
jgi:hypothetical protein